MTTGCTQETFLYQEHLVEVSSGYHIQNQIFEYNFIYEIWAKNL